MELQTTDAAFQVTPHQQHPPQLKPFQPKVFGSMLPPMARWWQYRGSGARVWRSVVELDHDEEMEPMHEMYGTSDAELEVQRTIIGPTSVHVDNKGIIDGLLWRGELLWIGQKAKEADL